MRPVYLALMLVILGSLYYLIGAGVKTFSKISYENDVESSIINIASNIDVAVDGGGMIDVKNTVFDRNLGAIGFKIIDNFGHATSTKIYLENGRVFVSKNNNVIGPITPQNVWINKMLFSNMSTSTIYGFKMEVEIADSSSSPKYMVRKFYNSYILH